MYLAGGYGERIQISKNARLDLLENIIEEGATVGEFCSTDEHLAMIAIESVLNGFVSNLSSERHEHLELLSKMACGIVLRVVIK